MSPARLRAGACGAAGSSEPGVLGSSTTRGAVSAALRETLCASTRRWTRDPGLRSAPSPRPQLPPLSPLFLIGSSPNWRWRRLGTRDSGSPLAVGNAGLPLSARRELRQARAGALRALLSGHFHTGRPRSRPLPLFPPLTSAGAPRRLRSRTGRRGGGGAHLSGSSAGTQPNHRPSPTPSPPLCNSSLRHRMGPWLARFRSCSTSGASGESGKVRRKRG